MVKARTVIKEKVPDMTATATAATAAPTAPARARTIRSRIRAALGTRTAAVAATAAAVACLAAGLAGRPRGPGQHRPPGRHHRGLPDSVGHAGHRPQSCGGGERGRDQVGDV